MHITTHAILDKKSRFLKAKKIELVIKKFYNFKVSRFLEVGCGSGYITSYFANIYGSKNSYAVDVSNELQIHNNFNFKIVNGIKLPFKSGFFDLIISNHVIEHVGDEKLQINHLREINRCLKKTGALYLAVPNKWRLVEPHYRLPFLSWLSAPISNFYLKIFRGKSYYDCKPYSANLLSKHLKIAGFTSVEATLDAIIYFGKLECKKKSLYYYISRLDKRFFIPFKCFIPTHIFICFPNRT